MYITLLYLHHSAETMVGLSFFREDSWDSLDCKEIQSVHPKGDQS